MKATLAAVLLLAIATPALRVPDPGYPMWGGALKYQVKVSMTKGGDGWDFLYTYDSDNNAGRYDHGTGQTDEVCALPRGAEANSGKPCSVLNALDGWLYISWDNFCCKCTNSPSLGIVKTDWLKRTEAAYKGQTTINDVTVDHWLVYAQYDNNYYATADEAQKAIRFDEHKHGMLK
jgi:hypothetical protein